MVCGYSSNLNKDDLNTLNNLEKDIGKTVLAFSCKDIEESQLSQDQIAKITDAEKKIGMVLVAVNS